MLFLSPLYIQFLLCHNSTLNIFWPLTALIRWPLQRKQRNSCVAPITPASWDFTEDVMWTTLAFEAVVGAVWTWNLWLIKEFIHSSKIYYLTHIDKKSFHFFFFFLFLMNEWMNDSALWEKREQVSSFFHGISYPVFWFLKTTISFFFFKLE